MIERGVAEVGAEPGIVAVGLEHEEAGEAAEPVDVGEAGGGSGRHGGCGRIVADFGFWEEKAEKKRTQRRGGSFVALGRKNPPFAKGAKGGAPSSSYVVWRNEEHRQECLCHRIGATVFGGGIVSYGVRAIRIGVGLESKKQDCWLTTEERMRG